MKVMKIERAAGHVALRVIGAAALAAHLGAAKGAARIPWNSWIFLMCADFQHFIWGRNSVFVFMFYIFATF